MTRYRLFFLDPCGRTNRATDLDHANDDAAIAAADLERCGSAAELWRGRVMVTRFAGERRSYR